MAFPLALISAIFFIDAVSGHGMMLSPVSRSSRWRYDNTAPVNYNDNELFCGGFGIQWNVNGGKCGACGDNYQDPVPRSNENTGTYGKGVIVGTYSQGSIANVTVRLTQNHKGNFFFSICELVDKSKPETEECFQPLLLADGSDKAPVQPGNGDTYYQVRLPNKKCDNCVLRWHYKTGNSWGTDEDGTSCVGCGPQEVFRSCADIAII